MALYIWIIELMEGSKGEKTGKERRGQVIRRFKHQTEELIFDPRGMQ